VQSSLFAVEILGCLPNFFTIQVHQVKSELRLLHVLLSSVVMLRF